MMKRLTVLMLIGLVGGITFADCQTVGGYEWSYYIKDEGAVIYNHDAYYDPYKAVSPEPTGAVTIPSTLGGKPVTRIGECAFSDCGGLTSITIPDSVTGIGESAFYGCSRLTSVTIPNGVTNIGEYAFSGCSRLTSVTIPNGVTNIEDGVFYGCSSLTSVTIPNRVTRIGSYAFFGSGLTSVTIPDRVTGIRGYAFGECRGLTGVYITDLATWCRISFSGYNGNPLSIAHNLYLNGSLVTNLTIPGSVTGVESYAFFGCGNLVSVTIPGSVTNIGYQAFSGCSGLDAVHITDLMAWCGIVFGSADANPLYYANRLYLNGGLVTDLTVPAGLSAIKDYAFYNCSSLLNVTIPDSVTSIGQQAFYGCSGLKDAVLPSRWALSSIFPASYSSITNVTVPSGSSGIANSAFKGCSALTSISIPDTVMSIGDEAFYNCTPLEHLLIPGNVTNIGDRAFFGCGNLVSVTIPGSVTNIGYQAFSGCSGLDAVHITDLMAWCGIVFGSADANPLYYANRLYLNGGLVTDLTVPAGLSAIKDYAFYNCSSLLNVTIPDNVTSIGQQAFYGCSGLKDAMLPSRWALSSIFPESYSSITNVTVSSGSSGIANSAFKGCEALTSISIPDTVTRIGDEAFYNCTSLEHLTIPEGVTSYGVNCFEGCPAYTLQLYRSVFGGDSGGGSAPASTTIVQQVESPYALTDTAADRAIASVTVNSDCAIDSFVLKEGKVYDSVLYISNTADHVVTLTLPSGYVYKAIKGARPLDIPANSQSILSITRVANNVFLVSREDLETIQ